MLKAMRISMGWLWSVALVLTGLWMWQHQAAMKHIYLAAGVRVPYLNDLARAGAFWLIAAGEFVFLVVVAGALEGACSCKALPELRVFVKTFVGAAFYLSLSWLVYLLFTMAA